MIVDKEPSYIGSFLFCAKLPNFCLENHVETKNDILLGGFWADFTVDNDVSIVKEC